LIQETACRFAEREIGPAPAETRTHRHPGETAARMGEVGFMGITISEEYGGAGMDCIGYVPARIEISEAEPPRAS